jgi:hypothetical protein
VTAVDASYHSYILPDCSSTLDKRLILKQSVNVELAVTYYHTQPINAAVHNDWHK